MTPEEYEKFRHTAVHALMCLNEAREQQFRIGSWERWDYDLQAGTLTFSQDGRPRVLAEVQVVGSTSTKSNTWLWAWANESIPDFASASLGAVRKFGEQQEISQLTEAKLPDDEYLGWELTAITAQIIGATGAYRCAGENGFLYVVFTDVHFIA